jgi:hypothetical protein
MLNSCITNSNLKIPGIPHQNTNNILHRKRKIHPKFIPKQKGLRVTKSILNQKSNVEVSQ